MVEIDVSVIRLDGGTQPRAALDEQTVADYAAAILAGATFPPVVVFFDGADYWAADGFHRIRAHSDAERNTLMADVRSGTRRHAVLYSLGANAAHGLRRSNADKRRAVETALRDPEWSQWSDRRIAEVCAVSDRFVNSVRDELRTVRTSSEPAKRVGKDGKARKAPKRDVFDPADEKKPAKRAEPKPEPAESEGGFDDDDLMQALRDRNAELEAENDMLRKAASPESVAEIAALMAQLRVTESQRDDYMQQVVELKRQCKAQQRLLDLRARHAA